MWGGHPRQMPCDPCPLPRLAFTRATSTSRLPARCCPCPAPPLMKRNASPRAVINAVSTRRSVTPWSLARSLFLPPPFPASPSFFSYRGRESCFLAGVDEFGSTSKIYPSTRGKGKGEKRIKEGSGVNSDTPFFSFVPSYGVHYILLLHTTHM